MFPQELLVALPSGSILTSIRTITRNVRTMLIESSDDSHPGSFFKLFETNLDQTHPSGYQKYEEKLRNVEAYYLRMKITRGWNDFIAVHAIEAEGRPMECIVK